MDAFSPSGLALLDTRGRVVIADPPAVWGAAGDGYPAVATREWWANLWSIISLDAEPVQESLDRFGTKTPRRTVTDSDPLTPLKKRRRWGLVRINLGVRDLWSVVAGLSKESDVVRGRRVGLSRQKNLRSEHEWRATAAYDLLRLVCGRSKSSWLAAWRRGMQAGSPAFD